jgi:hypothetical protein
MPASCARSHSKKWTADSYSSISCLADAFSLSLVQMLRRPLRGRKALQKATHLLQHRVWTRPEDIWGIVDSCWESCCWRGEEKSRDETLRADEAGWVSYILFWTANPETHPLPAWSLYLAAHAIVNLHYGSRQCCLLRVHLLPSFTTMSPCLRLSPSYSCMRTTHHLFPV